MIKEMKGFCFLYSETGTEGGYWAMQENGFMHEDGIHCSYEGLRELEENDDFTVYTEDGKILWSGIIHQDSTTGAIPHQVIRKGKLTTDPNWLQQVVNGMYVHWIQSGVDPQFWSELFLGDKKCLLKREENVNN